MTVKPVGIDENSLFPPRVETRLSATFAPRPYRYIDLPSSGIVSAHHSGGLVPYNTSPTDSISSMRLAASRGAQIIDLDVILTTDGVLVNHHDLDTALTAATTVTVANEAFANLPQLDQRQRVGPGWTPEDMGSIDDVLNALGGKGVMLTIELKGVAAPLTTADLLPILAPKIVARRLQESVYINFAAVSAAFASSVASYGLICHMYNCTSVALVNAAIDAGAKLIEIPYNATSDIVDAATRIVTDNGGRFVAGPIQSRQELAAMDPRIQGYVSNAPGYLNHPFGNRVVKTLAGARRTRRAGTGWISRNSYSLPSTPNWIDTVKGILVSEAAQQNQVQLRDMSGTLPGSGSFTFSVNFETLPASMTQYIGIRGMCPLDVPETNPVSDPAHKGYVFALRANGDGVIFRVDPTTGVSSSIGTFSDTDCIAGTTYVMRVDYTPTTVKLTRVDTGTNTGDIADSSNRGGYWHTLNSMLTGKGWLVDLDLTNAS